MSNKLTITNKGLSHIVVEGDLTFSTINKKSSDTFALLPPSIQVSVDLMGVENADSAGLALLLEWIKITRSKRVQLLFKNMPEQLLNLAKLSGLEKTDYFTADAKNQVEIL